MIDKLLNPLLLGAAASLTGRVLENRQELDKGARKFIAKHEAHISHVIDRLADVDDFLKDIDAKNPATLLAAGSRSLNSWIKRRMPAYSPEAPKPLGVVERIFGMAEARAKEHALRGKTANQSNRFVYLETHADAVWKSHQFFTNGLQPPSSEVVALLEAYGVGAAATAPFGSPVVVKELEPGHLLVLADSCSKVFLFSKENEGGDKEDNAPRKIVSDEVLSLPWTHPALHLIEYVEYTSTRSFGAGEVKASDEIRRRHVVRRLHEEDGHVTLPSHTVVYEDWDARLKGGAHQVFLVQGPPGGGKTTGITSYLRNRGRPFLLVPAAMAEHALSGLYNLCRDIILDDVDRVDPRLFLSVLNELSSGNRTIWITSNNLRKIPNAARRPGRVQQVLIWPTLSKEDIAHLCSNELPGVDVSAHIPKLLDISKATGAAGVRAYIDLLRIHGVDFKLHSNDITFTQPPSLDVNEVYYESEDDMPCPEDFYYGDDD